MDSSIDYPTIWESFLIPDFKIVLCLYAFKFDGTSVYTMLQFFEM